MTRIPTLLLAAGLLACAGAPAKKEVVWPDPPEKPRIKFAYSFANAETLDESGWAKVKRGILGGGDPQSLKQPMGMALSDDGQRLYIADFGAATVFLVDVVEKRFGLFASQQGFAQPFGVALDAEENVYVSDSGARSVTAYTRKGDKLWSVQKDLERPTGLAVDRARKILYVVDSGTQASQSHRVYAYDLRGLRIREVGGGKGPDDAQFHFPVYAAVDKDGKLYVGDTMNFRVQVFDPEGNFLLKYGEHGDSPGSFARIKGIAFDRFGNTYVVDGQHSVVQIFNRDWDPLLYFGGFAPLLEYFDIPSCIAIDATRNRIYVCNEHNARVNAYDLLNTSAEDSARPKDGGAPSTPGK